MKIVNSLRILTKNLFYGEKGSVLVLVALSVFALIGMTALVVDVGLAYAERVKLSNAVDAAALAGGLELMDNDSDYEVKKEAIDYAALNDAIITEDNVEINSSRTKVTVQAAKTIDLFFAKVLGFEQMETGAKASVVVGHPEKLTKIQNGNLLPLMLPKDIYDSAIEESNNNGEELENIEIRLLAGDEDDDISDHFVHIEGEPVPGNWGAINLADSGGGEKEFYEALRGDLNKAYEIYIGDDTLESEPGNKPQVDKEIEERLECDDVKPYGLIPLIEEEEKGGRTELYVSGFAVFEVVDTEKNPPGHDIIGHLRSDIPVSDFAGEITEDEEYDYGALVHRLVE